ncbi:MAG: iron-containing alcohol dehydrogenase [Bacillota bacterium]
MKSICCFSVPGAIFTGVGSVQRIGEEAQKLRVQKAMVVVDKGLVKTGVVEKVVKPLTDAGLDVLVFDGVEPEPRFEVINDGTDAALSFGAEIIVAAGGGSALDLAKVIAVMVTNGGSPKDYAGVGNVPKPGIPFIAIPTTAGTGSEVTNIAIFLDTSQELKVGIVSPYLVPTIVVVDPIMTITVPAPVTAATGMDALTHAIESYVSVNANTLTDTYALKAIELIMDSLCAAVADGNNIEARSKMAMGSLMAGIAFGNAGVGGVHALAYPLGGKFHISHGVSNTLMLPCVMEFNAQGEECEAKFAEIAQIMKAVEPGMSNKDAAQAAVSAVKKLADSIKVPTKLQDFGITEKDISFLAASAMKVTRLLANNPRTISLEDAAKLYTAAL